MRPGTIIAERFEIERHATSGGMGAVYRARDLHDGSTVALKMLIAADLGDRAPDRERFEREAHALSALRHPGIVRYIDHGATPDGELYLAMEWLEGEDLAQRLRREPLTPAEAVRLVARVARSLAPAHARGVIHRDLKPSNLFLPERDLTRVRILDFGVVRLSSETRAGTRSGLLIGTPGYMSPEQARGDRDIDARVDVFALGCVLFELLSGHPAFRGEHVMALLAKILLEEPPRLRDERGDLPESLDALVGQLMAKDRALRPVDGAAVADALDAILAGDAPALDLAPPTGGAVHASITAGERIVVSVVVAAEAFGVDLATARTLTPEGADAKVERLRAAVAPFGARLEVLADGSWVAVLAARAGADTTASDRAAQAARCALAMRRHVPAAPMVLATGRAWIAGRMPVGEVIDRAARMLDPLLGADAELLAPLGPPSSASRARAIQIDDVTSGLLDARFDIGGSRLGLELRGEREVVDRTRTLLGKATPCIGRERELGTLDATWAECVGEPVARAVVITAAAGVGKSRLRYEWLRALSARPEAPQVWLGRGDPLRAGAPYAMIAPALRLAAGILEGEPVAVQRRKLHARVGRHLPEPDASRVAEFLGELVGVASESAGDEGDGVQLRAARRDAMLMADQTLRAFVDFVAAECAARPLLLVLEDLHWGDAPSVKLIDAALRVLSEAPLMVLALARPEVLDRFPTLWSERGAQTLALVELTTKRSTRLVRAVLGDAVPEAVVARIVERAQGNAFYLEELIRAVAEGRSAGDDLPETVLAMVQGRIERLEPDARRLLRAASVFGEIFWRRGVGALVSDLAQLDDWLDTLVEREVIKRRGPGKFPEEEEYSFRHALVREAAYAMLTEEDRALGHRLAGEWLDHAGEGAAVVLAEHFERGRQSVRAASAYQRAADQALAANDFEAAIARAERAIGCGAQGASLGALRCLQAEAHRWRGQFAEGRACAIEALDQLPREGDGWHVAAAELALSAGRLGDVDALLAMLARLRTSPLDEHGTPARVIAWARTAGQLLLAGRREVAIELFTEVERVFPAFAGEPTIAARIALVRAMRALFSGDAVGYRAHTGEASEAFLRAGDVRGACMQRVSFGYASVGLGAHDEAVRVLREALATAERLGLDNVVAYSKNNLGLALGRGGALDEARRVESEALAAFRAQGDGRLTQASHVYLAQIRLLAGDVAGAEKDARAGAELSHAASGLRAFALATLAQVLLAARRLDEALEPAAEADALLHRAGTVEEGESLIRLSWAEALHAVGRADEARRAILDAREALLARATRIHDPSWRRSFLERVPEHARTLTLAAEWGTTLPPPTPPTGAPVDGA